jgi:similar to spore coat protein
MTAKGLAMHETLELHELTVFKTCCLTKSSTMSALVTDPELKTLMQRDVATSKKHVQDLQGLLSRVTTL